MNVLANVAGLAANQAGGLAQRVLGGGGGGGGLLGGPLVNAKAHTKAVCKDNDLNVHVNPNLQIAARATLNPHLQFGETPIGTYTVPAIVGLLAFFGCLLAAAFVMAGFYPRAFWTASGSVVALVAAAWLGLSHPKDRPIAAHFSNMMMVTGALYVALTSIARAKTTHPPGLLAGLVLVGVAGGLALALGKAAASQPQAAAEGFGPLAYQGAGAYGQGSAGASEAQRCEISPDWKYSVLRIRKTPHADGTVVREVEKKDLVGMTFYVEPGHTGFFKLIKLRYSTGVEEPLNGWIIKTYDGCQTLVPGCWM